MIQSYCGSVPATVLPDDLPLILNLLPTNTIGLMFGLQRNQCQLAPFIQLSLLPNAILPPAGTVGHKKCLSYALGWHRDYI